MDIVVRLGAPRGELRRILRGTPLGLVVVMVALLLLAVVVLLCLLLMLLLLFLLLVLLLLIVYPLLLRLLCLCVFSCFDAGRPLSLVRANCWTLRKGLSVRLEQCHDLILYAQSRKRLLSVTC